MMLEIHHRIKNNLQVVSGLLSLQAYNSSNQELKSKLQDSQGRIESIAGIHNILYKSDSREEILVEEYFQDIISYNQTLFSLPIAFALTAEKIILPMDKAIPLALTLNELINNSYKHAFEKEDNAQINISLKKNKKEYKFYYSDNGAFKQNEEDGVSMGMKIIEMMISQLKGELTIIKENNFQLIVRFPIIGD
jgi:two-component sensor histidine kinase